jgi:uncharacterized protein (DUF433 family)
MDATIHISPETYLLLQRRATEIRSTPDGLADTALRLQLGNSAHIEQRLTPHDAQAYVRGTRVAVRHIAAFLKAGHTIEEISRIGLTQLPAAAIYEAAAYYYDHTTEIESELAAESEEAAQHMLQQQLTTEQVAKLTGHAA